MLNEPTDEKLRGLRLGAFADAWREQERNADLLALGFDERLAMLVDAEWLDRQNKKLARNLREAKLRIGQAAIEEHRGFSSGGRTSGRLRRRAR